MPFQLTESFSVMVSGHENYHLTVCINKPIRNVIYVNIYKHINNIKNDVKKPYQKLNLLT